MFVNDRNYPYCTIHLKDDNGELFDIYIDGIEQVDLTSDDQYITGGFGNVTKDMRQYIGFYANGTNSITLSGPDLKLSIVKLEEQYDFDGMEELL